MINIEYVECKNYKKDSRTKSGKTILENQMYKSVTTVKKHKYC